MILPLTKTFNRDDPNRAGRRSSKQPFVALGRVSRSAVHRCWPHVLYQFITAQQWTTQQAEQVWTMDSCNECGFVYDQLAHHSGASLVAASRLSPSTCKTFHGFSPIQAGLAYLPRYRRRRTRRGYLHQAAARVGTRPGHRRRNIARSCRRVLASADPGRRLLPHQRPSRACGHGARDRMRLRRRPKCRQRRVREQAGLAAALRSPPPAHSEPHWGSQP